MRTTSFYSHNIRISTAIGKPKMAKFPRFAIPNQVTGQLPIHSRSQKSWIGRSWSTHPTLGSSKTLHGLTYVSWLELSAQRRVNDLAGIPKGSFECTRLSKGFLSTVICVAYTIVTLTYLCDTRPSSAATAETQHDAVGHSVSYIYIKLSFRLRHVIYVAYTIDSHLFM